MAHKLRFRAVDFNLLQELGILDKLRIELEDFWSKLYGLPRERVIVKLSSGSLVIDVQMDAQGQAEIEKATILAEQEAESVEIIIEAIKVRGKPTQAQLCTQTYTILHLLPLSTFRRARPCKRVSESRT